MTPHKFYKSRGTDVSRRVAEAAGTNLEYFRHLAHGRRRPSVELALALVEASNGEMTFTEIMLAKKLTSRRRAVNRLDKPKQEGP